jgi:hypothetical protein
MKKKILRIGLDFDGVVAYNPARIIRAPVTYVKRKLIGERKLRFYIPKSPFERFVWAVLHESSVFPALGASRLRKMSTLPGVEFYLISARFGYLQPNLYRFLRFFGMFDIFTAIRINVLDRQPHLHKHETIRELGLDYFIEDNWDIVEYLNGKMKTRIMWIYNIADRNIAYPDKYPYLDKALRVIGEAEGIPA